MSRSSASASRQNLEKNLLTVAMSDPLLFSLVQDLEFQTGYRIKQVVSTRGDIVDAINTCYPDKALAIRSTTGRLRSRGDGAGGERDGRGLSVDLPTGETALARRPDEDVFEPVAGLQERSEAAPIIDLVDLVVKSAIKSKASATCTSSRWKKACSSGTASTACSRK